MTNATPIPDLNAGPGPLPSRQQADSFLKALLDTSFSSFIVPRLIRLLYLFFMVVGALVALAVIVAAFNVNSALGVLALLLSPVVFLLVLVQARVTLELIAIVFRIEANTASLPRATR